MMKNTNLYFKTVFFHGKHNFLSKYPFFFVAFLFGLQVFFDVYFFSEFYIVLISVKLLVTLKVNVLANFKFNNTLSDGLLSDTGIVTVTLDEILSIENLEKTTISLYPNPSKSYVNIKTSFEKIKRIFFYDVNGKNVLKVKGNLQEETINIQNLKKGVYFVKVVFEKNTVTKKIFKQ